MAKIGTGHDEPHWRTGLPSGRKRPVIHEAEKPEYRKINKIRMPKQLDGEIRNCGAEGQVLDKSVASRTLHCGWRSSQHMMNGDGSRQRENRDSSLSVMESFGKMFDVNDGALGQGGGPLNHVLQFTHVARPRIAV